MNDQSVLFALKRVVGELDYDLLKEIENPEDPDSPDNITWEDLVGIFHEAYDEDQDFQKEQGNAEVPD